MIDRLKTGARRVVATLCFTAVFTACTHAGTSQPGGDQTTHPHELRVALQGDVSSLNFLLAVDLHTAWLDQLTMAWLLRYDRKNRPIPELATAVPTRANGGISADELTIAYDLRRNVTWSDGKPFTAADVAFTVKTINDPKTDVAGRDGWDDIAKMDMPNPYRIVFHLKKPFSPFVAQTFSSGGGSSPILPEHLLAHSANINTDPYNALPVGIGPFTFVTWQRGDHIELAANTHYWRGRPKLDRIIFKIIPSRDTILSELQTGDIDLWPFAATAYLGQMSALAGHRVLRQASFTYNHLDFNTAHPVLADPMVRRALVLAIDRRALRLKVGHGVGLLQDAILSPHNPYFDPQLRFTERNVAQANALLDGAGWKRGADGVRSKNGIRLNLDLATNTGSPDTDTRIELIRSDWKAIGAELTRRDYAPGLLLANDGIIQTGRFDVVVFAFSATATGDFSNQYGCKQFSPRGQNDMHWCDARAQAAMDDFLATSNVVRRKRDDDMLQEELVRDAPTMVLTIAEDLYGEKDELVNFHPNNVSVFDDFLNVDI